MACRISKPEWIIIGLGAAATDVIQFLIGFFGVPLSALAIGEFMIAANEIADPFIGGAIAIYLQLRGVSMISIQADCCLYCASAELTSLPGASFLFGLDIWYIYTTVKKEDAQEKAQTDQLAFESQFSRQPLNTNERREPGYRSAPDTAAPNHLNGRRAPNGQL